jgi:hypothetical protein
MLESRCGSRRRYVTRTKTQEAIGGIAEKILVPVGLIRVLLIWLGRKMFR